MAERDVPTPPPARGVRLDWSALPGDLHSAVEEWLGERVVAATTQPSGFSPGVAARLLTAGGRRVFLKAVGPEPNAESPRIHRREIAIAGALPPSAPVPRLLWSYDRADWVALIFEDIAGTHPQQPWRADELARVLDALNELATTLTSSPVPVSVVGRVATWFLSHATWWERLRASTPATLDPWAARHLTALAALARGASAAASGETLLHLDLRADNILLTPERVYIVDWPHAQIGPAWLDLAWMLPSIAMQGGPEPERVVATQRVLRDADPAALDAVIAAIAGYFTWSALQPPPPGLPTLRAFQEEQGVAARRWLARRRGWD